MVYACFVMTEPGPANDFLAPHVALLMASYRTLIGQDLLGEQAPGDVAAALYRAPFVVLSHGTEADPIFNYANLTAQRLFEMNWDRITTLPSRFSAEPVSREERARLMALVAARGFIDDYRGVRISASGRRFLIERATVWNVQDAQGRRVGQAATFGGWTYLEPAGPEPPSGDVIQPK